MQVNVAEKIRPCGINNQTLCFFTSRRGVSPLAKRYLIVLLGRVSTRNKKEIEIIYLFFIVCIGMKSSRRKPALGLSASELRAEELSLEEAPLLKRKSADPLNASDQDNRIQGK